MVETEKRANLDDGSYLFRFRSIRALLDDDPQNGGFQELEKQTIHFAKPETLNDPMEGLTDAFWSGDEVLWENLFRHYALSLLWYSVEWQLSKPEEIDRAKVGAWLTEGDLPTDAFRELYREFCADFCAEIDSQELAKLLARGKEPLRRQRLTNLLFMVHQSAVSQLFRVLKKHGRTQAELPGPNGADQAKVVVQAWESMTLKPASDWPVQHQLEVSAAIGNRMHHQVELGMLSRADDKNDTRKLIAIISRFPEMYVEAFLRDLHFTAWRVACFSRRCVNASMWGTYGHEHRGVALVFRTTERNGQRFFRVQGMHGTGSEGQELEVRSIDYRRNPPAFDSFIEIGRLSMTKLENTWMKSKSGVLSVRLREIAGDTEAWRAAHWQKFLEQVTWKHPDWAHEDEARLIASTVLAEDPAPSALEYDFSQLEGIVFGMRTTTEDKLRIAEVIGKKCRAEGRSDFRFFQAYYLPQKGEMAVAELGLLTFGETTS